MTGDPGEALIKVMTRDSFETVVEETSQEYRWCEGYEENAGRGVGEALSEEGCSEDDEKEEDGVL